MDEIKIDPETGQKYIVIQVFCLGCTKEIVSPTEADMELFRLGIAIHKNNPFCERMANEKLCQWEGHKVAMEEHGICPVCQS